MSCEQEGTAGEGRSKKSSSAASSRTLPGPVTKARDCGEEDPQDWAGAAWGLRLYLAGSPPSPRTQKGQLALSVTSGQSWHLSELLSQG